MKSLIYLLALAFVLISGCAKDALEDENGDLKKAMVTIPMKAWFCMTPTGFTANSYWQYARCAGKLYAWRRLYQRTCDPLRRGHLQFKPIENDRTLFRCGPLHGYR